MSVRMIDLLPALYERDETAWLEAMAELARDGRAEDLDLGHLAEYLFDMARRDRREVESRLAVLLSHLLKWTYSRLTAPTRSTSCSRSSCPRPRPELALQQTGPRMSAPVSSRLVSRDWGIENGERESLEIPRVMRSSVRRAQEPARAAASRATKAKCSVVASPRSRISRSRRVSPSINARGSSQSPGKDSERNMPSEPDGNSTRRPSRRKNQRTSSGSSARTTYSRTPARS